MAEKHIPRLEQHESHSHNAEAAELSRKNIERLQAMAEAEKQPSDDNVEHISSTARSEALRSNEVAVEEKQESRPVYVDQKALKQEAFTKTMNKVRAQLPRRERILSSVIHQKTVEKLSNVSSKTIARPSGILGGGLLACLGSSIVLYYAKNTGFTYNYTLLLLLYLAGFFAGIGFELLFKLARHK